MRESRRQLLRALVAVLCLLGAAWTCTAMLQPRRWRLPATRASRPTWNRARTPASLRTSRGSRSTWASCSAP